MCVARKARPRPKAAMRRLADFGTVYRRDQRELDREQERLRRERDRQIAAARKTGVPLADIAEALGLTHQAVSKLVRRG